MHESRSGRFEAPCHRWLWNGLHWRHLLWICRRAMVKPDVIGLTLWHCVKSNDLNVVVRIYSIYGWHFFSAHRNCYRRFYDDVLTACMLVSMWHDQANATSLELVKEMWLLQQLMLTAEVWAIQSSKDLNGGRFWPPIEPRHQNNKGRPIGQQRDLGRWITYKFHKKVPQLFRN